MKKQPAAPAATLENSNLQPAIAIVIAGASPLASDLRRAAALAGTSPELLGGVILGETLPQILEEPAHRENFAHPSRLKRAARQLAPAGLAPEATPPTKVGESSVPTRAWTGTLQLSLEAAVALEAFCRERKLSLPALLAVGANSIAPDLVNPGAGIADDFAAAARAWADDPEYLARRRA